MKKARITFAVNQIPAAGECANDVHSEAFLVIWLFTHAFVWLIGANLAHNRTITFLQNCLLSLPLLWYRSYWLMLLLVTVQKYRFFSYSALEGMYQRSDKILPCTLRFILVGFCLSPAIFHILSLSIPLLLLLLLHERDLIQSYFEQYVVPPLPIISMPMMILDGMNGSSLNREG